MEILKSRRRDAQKVWKEFSDGAKTRILIGAATCGRAAGALDVEKEFAKKLAETGLADSVEIRQTGCIGLCYAEPLVEIKRPGEPSVMRGLLSSVTGRCLLSAETLRCAAMLTARASTER